jgi:hypothetical protein
LVHAVHVIVDPNAPFCRRSAVLPTPAIRLFAILQNIPDAFISGASSLEPRRICMNMSNLQIAPSRPKPMPDACVAC